MRATAASWGPAVPAPRPGAPGRRPGAGPRRWPGVGAISAPRRAGRSPVRYVGCVSNKATKNALRAGTVTAGATLLMLLSSPAFAVTPDDGDDPGPGLSIIETLGLYVAAPIVLFLVIAALVTISDKNSKKSTRSS